MKLPQRKNGKGFTLIEILVVIAILAVLFTLGWIALSAISNRNKQQTAENEIALLNSAMQAYKEDNGGILPAAKGDIESSNILYKILYCDSKNKGTPDKDKNGVQLKPYLDQGQLAFMDGTGEKSSSFGIPVVKKKKKYYLLDPWGEPYRYRPGFQTETVDGKGQPTDKLGDGFNPDFDIFSLGADGKGNGRDNKGDNEDNISNVKSWK